MLVGANFGSDASITLPSGIRLTGEQAQAYTSTYANGTLPDSKDTVLSTPSRKHPNTSMQFQGYTNPRDSFQGQAEACLDYLDRTQAIPVTPEMYASWLYSYVKNGGKITHPRQRLFTTSEAAFTSSKSNDYALMHWLPTRSTSELIPTAYGAASLQLLVFPALAKINLAPSSGDKRPGWEYGHGTVQVLQKNLLGFRATTNEPAVVESFPDIDQLVSDMKHHPLSAMGKIREAFSLR